MSRDRRVLSVVNMNKPSKNSSDFYLTPLAAAVRSNDVKTVEKLLDADELAVREELMWRYGRNRTLLFAPVVAGHVHMVRLLIERGGADFETRQVIPTVLIPCVPVLVSLLTFFGMNINSGIPINSRPLGQL